MAVKLNAGEYKRGEMLWISPLQIIVEEELRGRTKPPTAEDIKSLAVSMMDNGQRQPVECRKVDDNRVRLNLGFTRMAAARLIVAGFTDDEGKERKDESFMLKVIMSNSNDQEAFIHNIVENAHRYATSAIDDAVNQRKLTEGYGYSDTDIAKLYGYKGSNKVGRLRRLLELDQDTQNKVHDGVLPVATALELLDIPVEKRAETLEAAMKENGKIDGQVVRQEAREATFQPGILNDENSPFAEQAAAARTKKLEEAAAVTFKPRSMRELREFLEGLDGVGTNDKVRKFTSTLHDWLAGKKTDKQLTNAFDRLAE